MKKLLLIALFSSLGVYASAQQALADSSFETSFANGSPWASTSTNFGTSLCDNAACGNCGGPCVPRTGNAFVWFGGTTNGETGTVSQTFNVTNAGNATLTYYRMFPIVDLGLDTLYIKVDANIVNKVAIIDSTITYEEINIALGPLSAGSHTLSIEMIKPAGAKVVNAVIDDVTLLISNNVGNEEIDFTNGIQITSNIDSKEIRLAYNFAENQHIKVTVLDMNGKVMLLENLENETTNQKTIHASGWATGIYIVNLTTSKGITKSVKVVL